MKVEDASCSVSSCDELLLSQESKSVDINVIEGIKTRQNKTLKTDFIIISFSTFPDAWKSGSREGRLFSGVYLLL